MELGKDQAVVSETFLRKLDRFLRLTSPDESTGLSLDEENQKLELQLAIQGKVHELLHTIEANN